MGVGIIETTEVEMSSTATEVKTIATAKDMGMLPTATEVGVLPTVTDVGVVTTATEMGALSTATEVGVITTATPLGALSPAMETVMHDATHTCPISLEVMTDPVVALDGHTYNRHAIEECWGGGVWTVFVISLFCAPR